GGWILSQDEKRGATAIAEAGALALTACWALAALASGSEAVVTGVLFGMAQLAWLWVLYRLFGQDQRDRGVGLIRPVVLALGFVELLQFPFLAALQADPGEPAAEAIASYSL